MYSVTVAIRAPLKDLKDLVIDKLSWRKIYLLYVVAKNQEWLMAYNQDEGTIIMRIYSLLYYCGFISKVFVKATRLTVQNNSLIFINIQYTEIIFNTLEYYFLYLQILFSAKFIVYSFIPTPRFVFIAISV